MGARDLPQSAVAVFGIDHRSEKPPRSLASARAKLAKRARDAFGLQQRQFERESLALGCDEQQALPAVLGPFALNHVTLIDELFEHAPERLLGDAQDIEQLRDFHARIAIDEV